MTYIQRLGLLIYIGALGILLLRGDEPWAHSMAAFGFIVGGMAFLAPWRKD